jgi:hypothetical protein
MPGTAAALMFAKRVCELPPGIIPTRPQYLHITCTVE